MYTRLRVMCPLFLSDFNETWILSTDFRKGLKYQISWRTVRWLTNSSMRPDRRTLRNKLSLFAIFPPCQNTWLGRYNTVQASVNEGFTGVFHVPQRTTLRFLHENGIYSVTPNHTAFRNLELEFSGTTKNDNVTMYFSLRRGPIYPWRTQHSLITSLVRI
jgi:hypothetical protein